MMGHMMHKDLAGAKPISHMMGHMMHKNLAGAKPISHMIGHMLMCALCEQANAQVTLTLYTLPWKYPIRRVTSLK